MRGVKTWPNAYLGFGVFRLFSFKIAGALREVYSIETDSRRVYEAGVFSDSYSAIQRTERPDPGKPRGERRPRDHETLLQGTFPPNRGAPVDANRMLRGNIGREEPG